MQICNNNYSSRNILIKENCFKIAALVIALVAGVFLIFCTCTTLSSIKTKWRFTQWVAKLPMITKSLLIFVGVISVGGSCFLLHSLFTKKGNSPLISRQDELEVLKRYVTSKFYKKISEVIKGSYYLRQDQYNFYYCLACLTDEIRPEDRDDWMQFLRYIHGVKVSNNHSELPSFTIDTTFEVGRLEGRLPTLEIEELLQSSPTVYDDLKVMEDMCYDAFGGFNYNGGYFFKPNQRVFVMRDQSDRQLLALICALEIEVDSGKRLLIHTLARKASAVKLGLTEKLKEYLESHIDATKYVEVVCEVETGNTTAYNIYKNLGFIEIGKKENMIHMKYQPAASI